MSDWAEEKAKELFEGICEGWIDLDPFPYPRMREEGIALIAAALREAYERGVKETLGIQSSVADLERSARADGLEEAAKMFDGMKIPVVTPQSAAKAIRSRAAEIRSQTPGEGKT